ncbi:MAG: CDP-alcohol phosphatidyltransferase family protein [Deltaproteobacteria bacterium]|nr:CDP-alcohol phosphatidyltransferase family protein [Deltaproteobacteria bacterium]
MMRPLTIVLMLAVADWRRLTPNIVTTGSIVAKLGGAALVAIDHREHAIAAALLIQLGVLLDHLDGTIARYRRCGTAFGSYYDKVSDAVTWLAICAAIGWASYKDVGEVALVFAVMTSACALMVMGYVKWVAATAELEAGRPRSWAVTSYAPPARTPAEWVVWFFSSIVRAVKFEEVDLFFWVGVGLVVDRLDLLIWLLFISQGIQVVVMIVIRGVQVRAIDVAKRRTIP